MGDVRVIVDELISRLADDVITESIDCKLTG